MDEIEKQWWGILIGVEEAPEGIFLSEREVFFWHLHNLFERLVKMNGGLMKDRCGKINVSFFVYQINNFIWNFLNRILVYYLFIYYLFVNTKCQQN